MSDDDENSELEGEVISSSSESEKETHLDKFTRALSFLGGYQEDDPDDIELQETEGYAEASFFGTIKGLFTKKPKGTFVWTTDLTSKLKRAVYSGGEMNVKDAPSLNGLILHLTEWNEHIQKIITESTMKLVNKKTVDEMMAYFITHQDTFLDKSGNKHNVSRYDGSHAKDFERSASAFTQTEYADIAITFKKMLKQAKEAKPNLISEGKKLYNLERGFRPINDASFAEASLTDKFKALFVGKERKTIEYGDKALEQIANLIINGPSSVPMQWRIIVASLVYAISDNSSLIKLSKAKDETADEGGFDRLIAVFRWYPNQGNFKSEYRQIADGEIKYTKDQVNGFGASTYGQIAATVQRIKQFKKNSDFLKHKENVYGYGAGKIHHLLDSEEDDGEDEGSESSEDSSEDSY